MNREILFRARRKDRGGWVSGYYVYDYKHDTHYIFRNTIVCPNCINDNRQDYSLLDHEIYADTLCQYTGLTDENGNKIWENDIVELPNKTINKIDWDVNSAKFALTNYLGQQVDFDSYDGEELEVIGNVFDNPELLEV